MKIRKLAWKNVWRNRRRSLVTIAAMAAALAALLIVSGMNRGMILGLERSVVELETGDIQIHAEGYRKKPSMYSRLEAPDVILQKLEASGLEAAARIRASGLAAGDKTSAGVMMLGVEPARDRKVSRVFEQVTDGAWLDPSDGRGVVIGARLAKTLHVRPGDDILLLSSAADGSTANEIYKVRGVLSGTGEAIDRGGVFLNAGALRDLLVLPEGAHQIIVRRPAGMALDHAHRLARAGTPDADVPTWKTLLPTIAQMLESQAASQALLSLILFTAVGIVILNAMMMAVFERIRELGVLKAIGMQPRTVFTLVLAEGAYQTLVAIAAGGLIAVLPLVYLVKYGVDVAALAGVSMQGIAFGTRWIADVDRSTVLGPVLMLAIIAFLAVLFPALRAARLQPIDAIHHQ